MFQSTWLQGVDWDTKLDEVSEQQWRSFQADLPTLQEIRVPRHVRIESTDADIEVHSFADASERAYAAVIYVRIATCNNTEVKLVAAKTKVAPIKPVTLPRLELCTAALLVRLASHVRLILGATKLPVHLWSDSTVALGWIRGHPSRWKTYANRVAEIQTTLPYAQWHHISGSENPADCASRGVSPRELVTHSLWCRRWLLRRTVIQPLSAATTVPSPRPALSAAEWEEARLIWTRVVQAENFKRELEMLARGISLPAKNPLTKLTPFVDYQGILRVGGRIKHSLLAFDERHPAILPRTSHLTRLVIEACHKRTLHGGVQLMLGSLRQQYWVPQGRRLVKSTILRCVTCVRWRAANQQQIMGDLPRSRVIPARPFLNTGVDYAGPIQLRTTKGRGHRAYKAFLAVFVCMSTKAVHLDVVSDYTAEAFLAALRRFTSRRGLCRSLHSDCGTNFVGADAQLRAFFTASSPEQRLIADQLASDRIHWRFNPPSAPHFGGLWEAAVKSLKHHLRRVIGEATLTFEEMSTLLAQIEAA